MFVGRVYAAPLQDMNTSVRALGMGNAYIGVAQGLDALFYNPAGLARNPGVSWTIADPKVGASGYEAFTRVQGLQSSGDFADTLEALYGENIWVGAGAKTGMTFPMIAFSVYDSADVNLSPHNPAYTSVGVNVVNDFGYTAGVGAMVGPGVELGMALKYVKRLGSRVPLGASLVGSLDPDVILENIKQEGTGYGLDLGMNITIPAPIQPTISFAWRNVGDTKFRAANVNGAAPPSERSEMIIGAALDINAALVSVTPTFDFRYLNRSDVQLTKKINFGVEVGLPLLDIRGGFHQGYYSAGVGLNLGMLRVDAATYGEELGEYAGQKEDRRYIVQVSMELGLDLGFGSSSASSSGSGKSGSGSGDRRSPSKRLKQRR